MVFSGPWSLDAIWWSNSPRILFNPFVSSGLLANSLVVWLSLNSGSGRVLAVSLGLDVLGFSLVKVTPIWVVGKDGNIFPGGWVPVWVIVSFFGAFKTISVSVVVLSGVDSSSSSLVQSSFSFSVCNVQSHVSISDGTVSVELERLVHSIGKVISSGSSSSSNVVGDGISGNSISNSLGWVSVGTGAHVLDNQVANQLWVSSASVLSSPFNGEERLFVEGHGRSPAVSSLSVVLGVKQSLCIVSVGVGLVKSVVRTSWALQVEIAGSESKESEKDGKSSLHFRNQ